MPDRGVPVVVHVVAADHETLVEGKLHLFTPVERLLRTLAVLAITIFLAATLIPIPIIHLAGIPLVLVVGLAMTGRQALAVGRLQPLRAPCPRCGGVNRLGGGLGLRSVTKPIESGCEHCRRPLSLRIDPPA